VYKTLGSSFNLNTLNSAILHSDRSVRMLQFDKREMQVQLCPEQTQE